MSAKNPNAGRLPLTLTENQRDSLIKATRLTRSIKDRLKDLPPGSKKILFTEKELVRIGDAAFDVISTAAKIHQPRLRKVIDKIVIVLAEAEAEAIQSRRAAMHKSDDIYQFKVTLKGIYPPIWRRFQIPDGTLGQLHEVLQEVMGWVDVHLHQFVIGDLFFGDLTQTDLDFAMDVLDEESVLISQLVAMDRKLRFDYDYDFGDCWEHKLVLEKTLKPDPKLRYPRCLEGARACPPEDCGGIWGYVEFVEAKSDPRHDEHEAMNEWYPGDFDPEEFLVDEVNKLLDDQ